MKEITDKPNVLQEYSLLPEYSNTLPSIYEKNLFGDYPLNTASIIGNVQQVQELIDLGADINCLGEDGYTPLHNAAEQGNIEIVKLLVALGVDPTIKDNDGVTPLELAILLQQHEIEEILKNYQTY